MTFEEDFPSLKGRIVLFSSDELEIQEHCLDKSKVREAIIGWISKQKKLNIADKIFNGYELLKELGLTSEDKDD